MFKYKPQFGDLVMILNYRGRLHPRTMWFVVDARPDLCRIAIIEKHPVTQQNYEVESMWVENETLVKVPVIDNVAHPELVRLPKSYFTKE